MVREEKVFCKNCRGWYRATKMDQCNLPVRKRTAFSRAVGGHIRVDNSVYGHPGVDNKNNDCLFYRERRIFHRLRNLLRK